MVPMERNMLPSEAINHDTSPYDEELVPDLIPDSKLPGKRYCKGFALINTSCFRRKSWFHNVCYI